MASGAPALALKAAIVVTAILAVLVLPSSGRCGRRPPTHGPAPPIPCGQCGSACNSKCNALASPECSKDGDLPYCDPCRSAFVQHCEDHCSSITRCNCDRYVSDNCISSCCCQDPNGLQCRVDCNKDCDATCV